MEAIIFVLVLGIGLYIFMLPTIIARRRNHPNTTAITVLNVVGSFFFGTGWLVALVWSLIRT